MLVSNKFKKIRVVLNPVASSLTSSLFPLSIPFPSLTLRANSLPFLIRRKLIFGSKHTTGSAIISRLYCILSQDIGLGVHLSSGLLVLPVARQVWTSLVATTVIE
uniref:Uncharacterized protein n=1 Tax=Arundo donax TaxID=35708 RepID=A0A0A9DBA6_ARUDO